MPEKAWLPVRAGIHVVGGFLIMAAYGLIESSLGHASYQSLRCAFIVLSFFAALLTWADVLELWVEPRWDTSQAGRPWTTRICRSFINVQIKIRRAIYARAQRSHEQHSFMASTHLMWGAWLSYILFWWLAPPDFHFRLFTTTCLIVSIADPVAALVGTACTTWRFNGSLPWCRHKSWVGSLAFGAVALSLLLFGLSSLGLPYLKMMKMAFLGAAAGAGCEAFAADQHWSKVPWVRLDDNLVVYLGLTIALVITWLKP